MNSVPILHFKVLALYLWFATISQVPAFAEPFPLPDMVPTNVPQSVRTTIQGMAQKNADQAFENLLLLVDEADRETKLSADQKTRLTVAAKGAVQYTLDEWIAPIVAQFRVDPSAQQAGAANVQPLVVQLQGAQEQIQVLLRERAVAQAQARRRRVLAERNADAAVREAELRRALQLQMARGRGGRIVVNGGGVFNGNVGAFLNGQAAGAGQVNLQLDGATAADQVIWKSAFASTLSDQQQKQLESLQSARREHPTETRVDYVVADLDRELLFDTKQREQVARYIGEFLESPRILILFSRNQELSNEALAATVRNTLRSRKFEQLFSAAQLARWREITKATTQFTIDH